MSATLTPRAAAVRLHSRPVGGSYWVGLAHAHRGPRFVVWPARFTVWQLSLAVRGITVSAFTVVGPPFPARSPVFFCSSRPWAIDTATKSTIRPMATTPAATLSLPDTLVADAGVTYSTSLIMYLLWTCWLACNLVEIAGDGGGHELRSLRRSLRIGGCSSDVDSRRNAGLVPIGESDLVPACARFGQRVSVGRSADFINQNVSNIGQVP